MQLTDCAWNEFVTSDKNLFEKYEKSLERLESDVIINDETFAEDEESNKSNTSEIEGESTIIADTKENILSESLKKEIINENDKVEEGNRDINIVEKIKEETKEVKPIEEIKEEIKEEVKPIEEVKEEIKDQVKPIEEVKEEIKDKVKPIEKVNKEDKSSKKIFKMKSKFSKFVKKTLKKTKKICKNLLFIKKQKKAEN